MEVDLKNRNSIMITMENGYTEISEFLLPFITDFKQKDDKGIPLIFYAVRKGQHNVLKHIIENTKDFDIDIQIDGVSLLFEAVKCMNPDAVQIILQYNPLVEHPNEFGKTPLMEACTTDDDLSAGLLIDAGANINARENKGNTPLHHSCISKGNKTGKLLLERGADMEIINSDGIPPLIAATMKKNAEMVRNLLLFNSNVNVMDAFGNSALIHAAQMNCPEIVEVLISFHADTTIINRNGNDALAAARKSGSPQIMKLLSENRNK
ncbi:ankyrin repeat protein, putative [Trichomonas vaginalis G3]|uniref:Ankyrin repeat protein, putative n=1 Tax=Trichomonas vaginalis (strain ATCC PRA-98 / G3) TaxID=412133 RepID=A2FDB4_TRIV3|nr:protein ubiquitination [Trichomonas vaginalis G3]EAX97116.1 ankyrin repeat protein, putative [Trichomonas vaginalis G3]KAI5513010.1 protein ubiquitination [Trichomonas vaginalis G3]|eukprot:XP_001310046.1 ankyrin repeat protein [Trichomonas vaginalis G3]